MIISWTNPSCCCLYKMDCQPHSIMLLLCQHPCFTQEAVETGVTFISDLTLLGWSLSCWIKCCCYLLCFSRARGWTRAGACRGACSRLKLVRLNNDSDASASYAAVEPAGGQGRGRAGAHHGGVAHRCWHRPAARRPPRQREGTHTCRGSHNMPYSRQSGCNHAQSQCSSSLCAANSGAASGIEHLYAKSF